MMGENWDAYDKNVLSSTRGEAAALRAKLAAAEAKIARLTAALNEIASWSEGPEVNGSFDEPGSARIAREALAGCPDV